MRGKSRRTEKTEKFLQTAEGHQDITDKILAGMSLSQVASTYGISRMTLHRWTKAYPTLENVINAAYDRLINNVEESAYSQCFARERTETTTTYDAEGNVIGSVTKEWTEEADFKMLKFVLINRMPEKWSEHGRPSPQSCDALPKVIIAKPEEVSTHNPTTVYEE